MAKVKVGDIKTYHGKDYICKGFANDGSPLWRVSDTIEKAHQWGDEKDYRGRTYVWTQTDSGKGSWRLKKDSRKAAQPQGGAGRQPAAQRGNGGQAPQGSSKNTGAASAKALSDYTPDELVNYANSASTAQLAAAVNDKKNDIQARQIVFNILKKRNDYDADSVDSSDLPNGHVAKPKAKVTYNARNGMEIEIGDSYTKKVGSRIVKVSVGAMRKDFASKSDDDLIKIINNAKRNPKDRELAVQEAEARGIDESKLNFSGTLQDKWDKIKEEHDLKEAMQGNDNEDEGEDYELDLKGFDMDAFMDKFSGGDTGWLDKKNPIVQKSFNFDTLVGRQQYDAVKDYQMRQLEGYLNPANKIGELNQQYENFVRKDSTPFFISAGGAGAGKSYGLWAVLEDNNVPQLQEGQDPDDDDWGWVQCDDPDDEKDFRAMLAKYNGTYTDDDGREHGHILVFDDADKILTTRSTAIDKILKKINDNKASARTFVNPDTGETEVWKGRIIVLTNKDVAAIQDKSEDKTAVFSRGKINNMDFTRNETIEILANRYEKMGLSDYQTSFEEDFPDPKDQKKIRKMAFNFMKDNVNDADPAKFTPRTFIGVVETIGNTLANGGGVRKINGSVQVGTDLPWQVKAKQLIKGDNTDIEKAETAEELAANKKAYEKQKEETKKKNPKLYKKLYGEAAIDAFISGDYSGHIGDIDKEVEDDEEESVEEAEKALGLDFGLTLEDVNDLLFG